MILTAEFFARPTLEVAPELLGATLFVTTKEGQCAGRIVEVEAYLGSEDQASHAARGPTPRSSVMFGPPGQTYVYLIYGMHHCLNFVTEPDGKPGAILIRALEPVLGLELMGQRRGTKKADDFCNGPGKLCRALGIDLSWNNLPLGATETSGDMEIFLKGSDKFVAHECSTRIGISIGQELPFRFFDPNSKCLST